MATRIETLASEVTVDPLTVGYAAMSNQAVADALNDADTGRTVQILKLDSVQIYEAIDTAEFDGLTAAQQASIDRILGLGVGIDVSSGAKARGVLTAAFGAGTASRTAIVAATIRSVSRGVELGIGFVYEGDVWDARN